MKAPAGRLFRSPAGAAEHGWPSLPRSFVAGALFFAVVAGLAGWLGRSATIPTATAPPPPPREVAFGPVGLSVPGTWASQPAATAGLRDLGPAAAAFAPVPGLGARAVIMLAPFDDPTLVPAPLRPLTGAAAPRKSRLAGLPAWTYPPRELASGWLVQLTVAPTTAGSVTAVCTAPADAWSGAADCAERLSGATLRGATPLDPSPTLAFRRRLPAVLDRLGERRAELRGRLRGATTRRGQARFAERLGRAHTRAAAALAPRAGTAAGPRRVVRALRGTAGAHRRLARAAVRGRPVRYRRAAGAIRRSDRALARAVARVR